MSIATVGHPWLSRLTRRGLNRENPHNWTCDVRHASTTEDGWGYRWSIATDVRAMLAIQDGGVSAQPEHVTPKHQQDIIVDLLTFQPGRWHLGTLSRLWQWLGYSETFICPYCPEYGRADLPCGECEGKPVRAYDGMRSMAVADMFLDADLVARYVAPELIDISGEPVRFGVMQNVPSHRNLIKVQPNLQLFVVEDYAGRDWRAVICGLSIDGLARENWHHHGEFREDPAADIGIVLEGTPFAGQVGSALVAADWLAEYGRDRDAEFLRRLMEGV